METGLLFRRVMHAAWRPLPWAALVASIAIMSMLPSQAQERAASGASAPFSAVAGQAEQANAPSQDMRASQLIGRKVKDAHGETLGEFKDFFIDVRARRVAYAVLSPGGTLGFGDKLYAYPMSAFDLHSGDAPVLALERDRMKGVPGFVRDAWPKADGRYFDSVDRYFGHDRRADRDQRQLLRATDLIGKKVDDRNGRDAGKVRDLVFDTGSGRLSYAVLDFDKAWDAQDRLVPIPPSALRFPERRRADLVLTLDRNQVDMSQGFEKKRWPDLNAAEFRERMNAYFTALQGREAGDGQRGTSTGSDGSTGSSSAGR